MKHQNSKRSAKLMYATAFRRSFSKGRIAAGLITGAGALMLAAPQPAEAFQLYNGPQYGNNLTIRLTTTVSWTPIWRTNNPSAVLTSPVNNANGSEGDLDLQHGMVSDQFDVLPVLDIKDGNYGAHFSGDFYLNTTYLGPNQNDQPSTLNVIVPKNTDFASATRNVEGLNARGLDAFVYGREYFGKNDSQSITVKIGRQTLLWGQSLFLTTNGIAAGQAPVDVITAQNNPNAQAQQVFEPVGQVVVTYQPNSVVTLQGYYQFEWQHYFFQGVGAYFSSSDLLDKGGQRLILGNYPGIGNVYAYRTHDLSPPNNNGQFGGSVQLTLPSLDLGFYALRFDSKTPALYLKPALTASESSYYYLVYPRDIWIEGASFSTTVGGSNVAGELSFRQHMNLDGGIGISTPANPGNANSDPLYPVGNIVAGQVSMIYISPAIPLDPDGISFSGELGFNHVLAVTANKAALASGRTPTAVIGQAVFTPQYYDVLPYLNISFPIGLAYNFYGRSMMESTENHGTGSINFGVTATYRVNWTASVTFNDYLGAPSVSLNGLADRNYVLLNVQHTF